MYKYIGHLICVYYCVYFGPQGMVYLHESALRTHGNLKPSNCLIDSRWSLRLTDFGLYNLRVRLPIDDKSTDTAKYYKGEPSLKCFVSDHSLLSRA